jgi:hypothetical protein
MPHVTATWPDHRPPQGVDRGLELATLPADIEALRRSEGTGVWVVGEPGIGRSSLVVEALTGASGLRGANKNRCRKASSHDDYSSPGPAVMMCV